MTFLYPFLLWGLLPLAVLFWSSKTHIKESMHTLILVLLLIALARPIQPQALEEALIDSKDLLIALDVSYSMRAKDIQPNRYDFAKETIRALLANNPSDNVMLLAFTTNPLLLSPATTDHALINIALENLNPEFILTKGTSLKRLFQKIAKINNTHKEMILITDGGEESQNQDILKFIRQSNISLHILALGSTEGSTVETNEANLLKDKEGNLVISRINPMLKSLVKNTTSYLEASSSPEATALALDSVLKQSQIEENKVTKMQSHNKEYYAFPLFLSLLLFLLLHTRAIKIFIILFTLLGIQAEASFIDGYYLINAYRSYAHKDFTSTAKYLKHIDEHSLQSRLLLAHTYYQEAQYKKALQVYTSIRSTSRQTKHYLYYHIANTYVMLQKYSKAKHYYAKALILKEDEDTRYNLALIATLEDKKEASLGIAHPKSQSNASSPNSHTSSEEDKQKEDKPSSSNSGKGEGSQSEAPKEKPPSKLISDDNEEENPHPLGSKVYELINKGYIREKRPW